MNRYDSRLEKAVEWTLTTALAVLFAALIALALGWPVKWLWNSTMPYLFGTRQITFWHAVGLLLLGDCLFHTWKQS